MNEFAALALIAVVVTVFALATMALLQAFSRNDELSEEPAKRNFGKLTPAFAGMMPSSAEGRQRLQHDLWLAGHYEPAALENFLANRSLLTVIPLIAGLAAAAFLAPTFNAVLVFAGIGLLFAILGFALPTLILRSEGKQRAEAIRRGIPMYMDALGLCLSTGNGLPDSFLRSGEAIRRGYPDLDQEVRVTHRHAQLRSMEHALDHWRKRIPLPEVGSLVFLLSQSDRLGTDVTRGLWELSSSYRVSARQNAETAANKVSFWMLFPTVLCLLSAAGIILVGPSLVEGSKEVQKAQDAIQKSSEYRNDVQDMLDRVQQKKPMLQPVPPVQERPQLAPQI
jgi:tight adherence protein C